MLRNSPESPVLAGPPPKLKTGAPPVPEAVLAVLAVLALLKSNLNMGGCVLDVASRGELESRFWLSPSCF